MKKFKTLGKHTPIDILEYVKTYLSLHENTDILIGCDSQNRGADTIYAVVLAMYTHGKGAHVIYNKFKTIRERDHATRLMKEVWFSIDLANELLEAGIPRAKFIDIDLNPNPKYKSNDVLAAAVGWAQGLGYNVRHKGDSPMMTYAADLLVKG
jgi:predicted RNase H-related nuclease YkuK (DUF458 family)